MLGGAVHAEDEGFLPSVSRELEFPEEHEPPALSTPVPESEMTRITFSLDWLLKNDTKPDSGIVRIAFPETWLTDGPKLSAGEESVVLVVPTRLLLDHNTSKRDGEIVVTFPDYYFNGLPVAEEPVELAICERDDDALRFDDMDYEEREFYKAQDEYDITGASGRVRPYDYENYDDQYFTSYHEIEIGDLSTGDFAEIIVWMNDFEDDTRVCFAIWDDGDWDYTFKCVAYIDILDTANYEVYKAYDEEEHYHYTSCWIEYPDDTWYYGYEPDDTPTSTYVDFIGSGELAEDEVHYPWTESFRLRTRYLWIQQLLVDGEWCDRSDVEDIIEWNDRDGASHVRVDETLSSLGLRFDTQTYNS